jgi:WD40 repeat protein
VQGHSNWVNGVAVTPDGQRAVSASSDKTLKVWDLKTGRKLCTLKGHSASVDDVAVTADGQRAVSVSSDQTLKVWDLETRRALRTLEWHSGFLGVVVTADGQRAVSRATASSGKTLKVCDLKTGRAVATFDCDAAARCCTFAGNQTIIAGDAAGRLYFLRLEERD